MLEKLEQIEKNYEELTAQISSPEIMSDISAYTKLMKQHRCFGRNRRKIPRSQENERRTGGRERNSSETRR